MKSESEMQPVHRVSDISAHVQVKTTLLYLNMLKIIYPVIIKVC